MCAGKPQGVLRLGVAALKVTQRLRLTFFKLVDIAKMWANLLPRSARTTRCG